MYERDRQTYIQTDRRTPHDGIDRACTLSRGNDEPTQQLVALASVS